MVLVVFKPKLDLCDCCTVVQDKSTGDVLVAWSSSYTGADTEVFPVQNDPVNALLYPELGLYAYYSRHTNFGADIMLQYPNPLPPQEYPQFSSGDTYIGGELFQYFAEVHIMTPCLLLTPCLPDRAPV